MPRLLALLALTACAGAPAESAPVETTPVAREPEIEPAPDAGPPAEDLDARYAGREALRVMRGRASYYSDRFTGRPTASGDPYDPRAFTAASRTLPFGTIVRVVRVDTGASVVVRVNDRGPFRDHRRILDLSRAAAERLDMVRAGVIDIRAEIVDQPSR